MITGRLENWIWDNEHSVLWGFIYDDERKRFRDGTWIHTSIIDSLDPKDLRSGAVVKTLNSLYLLGKPSTMPTPVEKDCIHFYEEVKEKLKGTKWLVIGTPNPVRSPSFISYVSFNTREEAESWIKTTRHFTIFAIKEVQWEEGEGL